MRAEKVLLSIAGIFIGVVVAGVGFYIWQTTKSISPSSIKTITISKTPTVSPVMLVVDSPIDEDVISSRVLQISGKADPKSTIVITTDGSDLVVYPTATGAFSASLTLDSGENRIFITAVMPDGKENQKVFMVNSTTEKF